MECQQVQDWLLQAEDPDGEAAGNVELRQHLRICAACQQCRQRLVELEQSWRALPVPVEAVRSREVFLARLSAPAVRQPAARRLRLRRWAVAALVLLTLGLGTYLFLPAPEARASSDLVAQLLDWNLELTEAPSVAERRRLHEELAPALQGALQETELTPEDRELAHKLLANAAWLTDNEDAIARADRFDDLAEELLSGIKKATLKKDGKRVSRLAGFYCRVAEKGFYPTIERAQTSGKLNQDRRRQLDGILHHDATRSAELTALQERAPGASGKVIHKALEMRKHHHRKWHGKGGKK